MSRDTDLRDEAAHHFRNTKSKYSAALERKVGTEWNKAFTALNKIGVAEPTPAPSPQWRVSLDYPGTAMASDSSGEGHKPIAVPGGYRCLVDKAGVSRVYWNDGHGVVIEVGDKFEFETILILDDNIHGCVMRLESYELQADETYANSRLEVDVYSDGKLRLVRNRLANPHEDYIELSPAFDFPRGKPFGLSISGLLSMKDREAYTRLAVDGVTKHETDAHNWTVKPIPAVVTRSRLGIAEGSRIQLPSTATVLQPRLRIGD